MRILPGLPGQHELRFWVPPHAGGLLPDATLQDAAGQAIQPSPVVSALRRPGTEHIVGHRVHASGLEPDHAYRLRVTFEDGSVLTSEQVRTLPARLNGPFTIAAASCYSLAEDPQGDISLSYPPSMFRFTESAIRLRFLTGDQVYMDLDPRTGNPLVFRRPDPWAVYETHWSNPGYSRFLAATPTGCLADDHEYWNDFPHRSIWLPWTGRGLKNPIGQAADEAFELYQAALFSVDKHKLHFALLTMLAHNSRLKFWTHPFRFFKVNGSDFVIQLT